jgi:3-oxo-5-alpha-steroid 4-dehydrogenase 1
MGKTSISSSVNIPGKLGWFTMEIPGTLTLLATLVAVSRAEGLTELPWQNYAMAGMFVTHYAYRAVLSPLLLNPSMADIHLFMWASALVFQVVNGVSIGGWIGGYGPRSERDWAGREDWVVYAGMALWAAGFAGNVFHDEVLRDIRRSATRKVNEKTGKEEKVYAVPERGLFKVILYAHYFCEWIEWCGFWVVGGWACLPAQTFVFNEVLTMLPRAWNGYFWYVERFGKEKIGDRKAVIPFLL